MSMSMDPWAIDPRPDRRGPRSIAVLLALGAVLLGLAGLDALQHHALEDLPAGQVEMTIETPNLNDDVEVTPEQYQAFHDEARDSGAYAWRGWSLVAGMSLVVIGSVGLYALKPWGARLSCLGAVVGLVGGSIGGFRFQAAAEATMEGMLVDTQTYLALACSVMTGLCLAMAAMPLFNHRARLALFPEEE